MGMTSVCLVGSFGNGNRGSNAEYLIAVFRAVHYYMSLTPDTLEWRM